MNPDDIGIDPRTVAEAEHLDRVDGPDGHAYRVLVDFVREERHVVPDELVDYGRLHPLNKGVIGFLALLGSVISPLFAGTHLAGSVEFAGTLGTVGVVLASVLAAWALGNLVYYRTFLGEWLWLFLEYNEHKHLILRGTV